MKRTILTMVLCVLSVWTMAQNSEEGRDENPLGWNVAVQGGPHFSAFENTKHGSFFDGIDGHVAMSVGYDFSHGFGTRLEIGYAKNTSGTNVLESGQPLILYSCKDVELFADAIFNVSHLFSIERRTNFEVEAKLYAGAGVGFPDKGTRPNVSYYHMKNPKTAFAMRVGMIVEWHVSESWGLLADARATGFYDNFNGVDAGKGADLRFGLSLGAVYHF